MGKNRKVLKSFLLQHLDFFQNVQGITILIFCMKIIYVDMICLSSTLVKPELLIKSFFSFPKFSKAELAVLRFQREYTVNVTEKKGQCATKIKKKTPANTKKRLLQGQTQHGNCYCGIRFLRLFYVKQSSVACIFYILRPSS